MFAPKIFQFQFFQLFFEGYHFLASTPFIIYIYLIIN